METRAKPTFNVRPAVTTIEVDGVVYNAQPVGPVNWHQARDGDYTEGFKQGVMSEQLNLVHSSYINKNSDDNIAKKHAKSIVGIARNHLVTGNTAVYGGNTGCEWVFAQDFPEVKEGRIVMNQDILEARLSTKGMRKINDNLHISADGQVRAMKRAGFRNGDYTVEQMTASNQPILMTGDEQSPSKMVDMMKLAEKLGYLSIPSQGNIRVPDLDEGDDWLGLDGVNWDVFDDDRYSFGVRQ